MRVAALYDIHGNLPALEAVLADVRRAGVDLVVVGGDVLPGPMPAEALRTLRELDLPTRFIRGNGDRVVLTQRAGGDISEVPVAFRNGIEWTASQIDDPTATWIGTWAPTTRLPVDGLGDVLFCHATPHNDTDIFTSATREEELLPIFASVEAPVVVCGHTHMQFDRWVGPTRVVNAGSVGMSFQGPGAYWLLLDGDVLLQRTMYELQSAATRVRRSGHPQADEFAARNILQPPTQEVMLEAFAKVPLAQRSGGDS
jgi:predicted phosphodiesterase